MVMAFNTSCVDIWYKLCRCWDINIIKQQYHESIYFNQKMLQILLVRFYWYFIAIFFYLLFKILHYDCQQMNLLHLLQRMIFKHCQHLIKVVKDAPVVSGLFIRVAILYNSWSACDCLPGTVLCSYRFCTEICYSLKCAWSKS